jgi:hypothetical protein
VLIDDVIDIGKVDKGVPMRRRINHHHGTPGTAIETTRLVDSNATFAVMPHVCNAFFHVVERRLGWVLSATCFAIAALVEAHKDVVAVIGIWCFHEDLA